MSNERIDTNKYDGHRKGPWWTGEWFNDDVVHFEKGYCVEQRIVNESPVVDHSGEWICLVDNEADAKLIADAPEILAELKKMYKREDELLEALRIIRDDLDEAIAQGNLPITSTNGIDATKIRNFANDASQ